MDHLSYISPAMVRSLIVPINQLDHVDLRRIIDILKRVRDVRVVDLIHNPGKFNPQAYPHGHIFYNFITKDEDNETILLHDFEPFRKTNVVIGVAKWNEQLNDDTIRELKQELKKRYTSPISQFIMIFDSPKGFETKISEVYTVEETTMDMETKLCDLTSRFLNNFSTYASAYEHTTLRSPGNIVGSLANAKRKHPATFEMNHEKTKQLGSKGRKQKLNANFYMMAGNLKTALNEFSQAVYNLKLANDFLWLASALDGLAVCLFLLTSIGVPYQLPTSVETLLKTTMENSRVSLSFSSPRPSLQLPRASTSSVFSGINELSAPDAFATIKMEVVESHISNCGKLAAFFYEKAANQGFEDAPQIVFAECLIRYMSIEVSINVNQGFDLNIIQKVLKPSSSEDERVSNEFNSETFNQLCHYIMNTKFEELSEYQQMKIYHSLSRLYLKTNMKMKYCLMVNCFFDSIIASQKVVHGSKADYEDLGEMLEEYCLINHIEESNRSPNHLQKKILMKVLRFCEKISFHKAYIEYAFIGLQNFRVLLTHEEQLEIHNNLKQFAIYAKPLPDYWDKNIFVDFQFEVEVNKIVEGEECNVSVLLRNPYAFEIDIKDLQLSTTNNFPLTISSMDFGDTKNITTSITHTIKPYSELVLPLSIIPLQPGILEIDGIKTAVDICESEVFSIYDYKPNSFSLKLRKDPPEEQQKDVKTWKISVVHEQPLLKTINVNLSDKWLMLLDGEHRRFRVDLKNISKTEINHLISKFKDSTTEIMTAELGNKGLQPNEIYEIEYQLLKKKPFKILNKDQLSNIKGYDSFHLDVEIMGKLGVKEATLVLEYSYQKDASIEFQRNLTIPVNLTVYPSVELAGCDIIPLTSNTRITSDNNDPCWQYLRDMKESGANLTEFCLLALDFVNMWSEQMEIAIDAEEWNTTADKRKLPVFKSTYLIHSRKNIRMFVPLLRMDLTDDYLNKRIPSLRNKQFVVDKKTPIAEQSFIKQSFWYKEEILKRISSKWRVSTSVGESIHAGKTGDIDMRGFRFSSKMIEVLEIEKVGVDLELLDTSDNRVSLDNIILNSFYTMRITLTNRKEQAIFGMIRHIPVCKDPPYTYEKKILINGALQNSIDLPLQPNESRVFELGIIFMEKGDYEWGAVFDELNGWDDGAISIKKHHLQREQLKFTIS